jgi:CO/xanthine dehydrogenase FAD-binding subunit
LTPFEYVRPASVDDVVRLLEAHGPAAHLLAGGTDLLVRLRHGHLRPRVVIDLKRARGLDADIVEQGACLRVGAGCVMADLIRDERIRAHFPALVEAARVVGSVQIRHRATLVGNVCNASPAADTAPALLVYHAVVNAIGPAGPRHIPIASFFTGPGKTVLARGEIVSSLDLPIPDAETGAAFTRLTRRRGVDLATLTVACLLKSSGEARVALGAVAPTPVLVSLMLTDSTLDQVVAHASPISDVRASRDYRAAMLPVFIERALQLATDRLRRRQAGG